MDRKEDFKGISASCMNQNDTLKAWHKKRDILSISLVKMSLQNFPVSQRSPLGELGGGVFFASTYPTQLLFSEVL